MKCAFITTAFLVLITQTFLAISGELPDQSANPQRVMLHDAKLWYAAMDEGQKERELARQLAPIKSKKQLSAYLATHLSSPLAALSSGAKRRFIRSLVFSESGLGSYDYADLRVELTATQIYRLLAMFGAQHTIGKIPDVRIESPTDQLVVLLNPSVRCGCMNARCAGPATCEPAINYICTENC